MRPFQGAYISMQQLGEAVGLPLPPPPHFQVWWLNLFVKHFLFILYLEICKTEAKLGHSVCLVTLTMHYWKLQYSKTSNSGTSNSGSSEKRTNSLQQTDHLRPIDFTTKLDISLLCIMVTDQAQSYLSQSKLTSENGQWNYTFWYFVHYADICRWLL